MSQRPLPVWLLPRRWGHRYRAVDGERAYWRSWLQCFVAECARHRLSTPICLAHSVTTEPRVTRYRSVHVHLIAFAGCLLAAVPLCAQAPPGPEIAIRLYDTFGIANGDIRTAQDVAGVIFKDAGVQAHWRECSKDVIRSAVRQCGDALNPTEVIVRILTERSEPHGLISLGYSLVPKNTRAVLATVFGNRVTAVAQRLHLDRATLLGQTIAHEVGHLLLGTSDHVADGLMRGHWNDAALLRGHADGWRFSRPEASRIKAELSARDEPRPELLTTHAVVDSTVVKSEDAQ